MQTGVAQTRYNRYKLPRTNTLRYRSTSRKGNRLASHTVKVTQAIKSRVDSELQAHETATNSEYEVHRYKSPTYGNVTIYMSGKGLCQGNDTQVDDFASEILGAVSNKGPVRSAEEIVQEFEDQQAYLIGTDEFGEWVLSKYAKHHFSNTQKILG